MNTDFYIGIPVSMKKFDELYERIEDFETTPTKSCIMINEFTYRTCNVTIPSIIGEKLYDDVLRMLDINDDVMIIFVV